MPEVEAGVATAVGAMVAVTPGVATREEAVILVAVVTPVEVIRAEVVIQEEAIPVGEVIPATMAKGTAGGAMRRMRV
jgi:hypothetical protein